MTMTEIDVQYLDECFIYDPDTGDLTWKERPAEHFPSESVCRGANTRCAGKLAGTFDKRGYRQVHVNRKLIFAHRIIWAMTHRRWPKRQIDHINGRPGDNRLCNLRVVTNQENQRNRKLPDNNSTGAVGVTVHTQTGAYVARIKVDRKTHHLGAFETFSEACAARKAAEKILGFHKNHGRV